jgi:ribosomal-protein-alanine N-acetyltransferase
MNRPSLTIREVGERDGDLLACLFEDNDRPEVTTHFHPFPLTSQTARDLTCGQHRDRFYVAISDGQFVGFTMLRGWDEGFEVPSFGVFVDHRHHGKGIGRELTEFAIAEARRLGCESVRLTVHASNDRGVHIYKSLGFEEAHREPVLKAGRPDQKIVMMKALK